MGKASLGDAYENNADEVSATLVDHTNLDDDTSALKIFGGYRPNKYLAVELNYLNLGNIEGTDYYTNGSSYTAENKIKAYGLKMVGFYPITDKF